MAVTKSRNAAIFLRKCGNFIFQNLPKKEWTFLAEMRKNIKFNKINSLFKKIYV